MLMLMRGSYSVLSVLSRSKSDEDSCRFLQPGDVESSNDYADDFACTSADAYADEEEQLI